MPYAINKYSGTLIATVADGTIDNTTDLKIIGKNYAGYGEVQNENFLYLLENFANNNPPPRPISGQLWYDSTNGGKLKFYDGTKFRTTGGSEISDTPPTGLTEGDFWFDTINKQLFAWSENGAGTNVPGFVLVGPQSAAGQATTQMRSRTVRDSVGGTHAIIEAVTNGVTIFIISSDGEWTLDSVTNPIAGFTNKIHQGVTLYNTGDDGVTSGADTTHRFWGTASNAIKLGGLGRAGYVEKGNASFDGVVNFADIGFTVGTKLRVYTDSSNWGFIDNQLGEKIYFKTKVSSQVKTPLIINGSNLETELAGTSNIGTALVPFGTVYANTFFGAATKADTLKLGAGDYRAASSVTSSGTVVVRTNEIFDNNGVSIPVGAVRASYFVGTATSANYADLAENYLADEQYEVGTVVMVGGEKEITAAQVGFRALGAISEKPAYLMNSELVGGTAVALKGRVPVKVNGSVMKGQRLVAGPAGTAQAAMGNTADVFAIALESSDVAGIKLVECVIL
jgi:hypothetical protein